jgi:hypothetical protein
LEKASTIKPEKSAQTHGLDRRIAPMKLFISWSGERSQRLAQALHGWLPLVLHYVKPWLSEADVSAGDRWAQAIAKELETSSFGIICVTPENLGSPWVLFEAGALAKSMQGTKVIPLLFNLEFSDVSGPLAQFQAKKFERSGLAEVIHSVNQSATEPIPEDRARQLFTALWPELEKQLIAIPAEAPTEKHMRPSHEILEELVTGVRGLDSRFRDLENVVMDQGPRSRRRRFRHFHPGMFDDMAEMVSEEGGDDTIVLLMFGGLSAMIFLGFTRFSSKPIGKYVRVIRKRGKRLLKDYGALPRLWDAVPSWRKCSAAAQRKHT